MEKEAQEQELKDKEKAKSLGTEYSGGGSQEQSEYPGIPEGIRTVVRT